MKRFDSEHPVCAPARGCAAFAVPCLGGALVARPSGAAFWAALFGALGIWCFNHVSPAPRKRGGTDEDRP